MGVWYKDPRFKKTEEMRPHYTCLLVNVLITRRIHTSSTSNELPILRENNMRNSIWEIKRHLSCHILCIAYVRLSPSHFTWILWGIKRDENVIYMAMEIKQQPNIIMFGTLCFCTANIEILINWGIKVLINVCRDYMSAISI